MNQNFINKNQLVGLVEKHFFNDISENSIIKEQDSWELLTPNRLDVCFKIFFLKKKDKISNSEKFYSEHISVMTNGLFREYGNSKKNSFKVFLKNFIDLEKAMDKNYFDELKSIIPLGRNNTIIDGAHRLSISILKNIKIKTLNINVEDSKYNWRFFLERGIKLDDIEIAVSEFCNYNKKIHASLIWPVSKEYNSKIIDEFDPDSIVYIKKIKVSNQSIKNILVQVYKDHSWLGKIESGYDGIVSKFAKIYKPHGEMTLIFFTSSTLNQVIELKEKIRTRIGIDKHSIHITDNQKESIIVSEIFLNKNSLEFYNNSNNFKYPKSYKLFNSFKQDLLSKGLNLNDFIIVGSMPFSLQGITEANDIDFLTTTNYIPINKKFNSHNKYLKDYKLKMNDIIYDPKNYFIYDGVKFMSNKLNLKFKKNRGEVKDKLLIKKINQGKSLDVVFLQIENYVINLKYKFIALAINYSKLTGTYSFFKFIYKKIKLF